MLASVGNVLRPGPVAVRLVEAKREAIASRITANGKVEAVLRFDAYARSAATVRRVLVHEGQHVQRGDLLVELSDADARAQAARALAQLRSAEADLDAIENNGNRRQLMRDFWQLRESRGDLAEARHSLVVTRRLEQLGVASTEQLQSAEQNVSKRRNLVVLLQQELSARYSPAERELVTARVKEARTEYEAAQGHRGHLPARRSAPLGCWPAYRDLGRNCFFSTHLRKRNADGGFFSGLPVPKLRGVVNWPQAPA